MDDARAAAGAAAVICQNDRADDMSLPGPLSAIAVDDQGRYMAVATDGGEISVWRRSGLEPNWERQNAWPSPLGPVCELAWGPSPYEPVLATTARMDAPPNEAADAALFGIQFWRLDASSTKSPGDRLPCLRFAPREAIDSVCGGSPTPTRFAAFSFALLDDSVPAIYIHPPDGGPSRCADTLPLRESRGISLCWCPDRDPTLGVVLDSGEVSVWRMFDAVRRWHETLRIRPPASWGGPVVAISWSVPEGDEGSRLALLTSGRLVRVLWIGRDARMRALSAECEELDGTSEAVSVGLNRFGTMVYAIGRSSRCPPANLLQLWDLRNEFR